MALPTSLVVAAAAAASVGTNGWRAGHTGIDRPGAAFLRTSECADSPECCFDVCHSNPRCESWSLVHDTCSLRSTVPSQVVHHNAASGVKRAVSGLQPLLYTAFPIGSILGVSYS